MGNRLGSTLAKFFSHFEKKLFENPENEDVFQQLYLQFIDVYAVFQSQYCCSKFLNILNSRHKDIQFTMKKATNALNLADVEVKMKGKIATNFYSIYRTTWKYGLITSVFLAPSYFDISLFQLLFVLTTNCQTMNTILKMFTPIGYKQNDNIQSLKTAFLIIQTIVIFAMHKKVKKNLFHV